MDDGRDQHGPAAAPEGRVRRGVQLEKKRDGAVREASPAAGSRETGLPPRTRPVPGAVFGEAAPSAPSKALSKASTDATLTTVSPSRTWSTLTPGTKGTSSKVTGRSIWGPTSPASHQMQSLSAGSELLPAHPSSYGHSEAKPPQPLRKAEWAAAQHAQPAAWPSLSNASWGASYSMWGPGPGQGPAVPAGQSASWGVAPPSHFQVRGQPGRQPLGVHAQPWWQQEGWQVQQAGGAWQQQLPPPHEPAQQQMAWGWQPPPLPEQQQQQQQAEQGWHLGGGTWQLPQQRQQQQQQQGLTDVAQPPAGGGAGNDAPEHLVRLLASLQSSRQFAELAMHGQQLGRERGQEPAGHLGGLASTAGQAGNRGLAGTAAAVEAAVGSLQEGGSPAAGTLPSVQPGAEVQVAAGEGDAVGTVGTPALTQGTGLAGAGAAATALEARELPSGLSRECQELWRRYGLVEPEQALLAQQAAAPSIKPKPSPFAAPSSVPDGAAGAVGTLAEPEAAPAGDLLICVPTLPLSEHLTRSNSGASDSMRAGEYEAQSCAATLAGASPKPAEAAAAAPAAEGPASPEVARAAGAGPQPAAPAAAAAAAEQLLARPQEQREGSPGEGLPSCSPVQQGSSLPAAPPGRPPAAGAPPPALQRARAPAQVSTQQLHSVGAQPQPAQQRLQAGEGARQQPEESSRHAAPAVPAAVEVFRAPQQLMQMQQAATPPQESKLQAEGSLGAALAGYNHHQHQQQQATTSVPSKQEPLREPQLAAAQPQQQATPLQRQPSSLQQQAPSLQWPIGQPPSLEVLHPSLQQPASPSRRQAPSSQQPAPPLQRQPSPLERPTSSLQRQPSQLEMLRVILELEDHLLGAVGAQRAQQAKQTAPGDDRQRWEERVSTLLELQQERDPAARRLAMATLDILLAVHRQTVGQGPPAAPKPPAAEMQQVAGVRLPPGLLKNEGLLEPAGPIRDAGLASLGSLSPKRELATQAVPAPVPAPAKATPSAMEVDGGGSGGGAGAAGAGAASPGAAAARGALEGEESWVQQREQSDDQIAAEALVAIFSSPVPSRGGSRADDRAGTGTKRRERQEGSLQSLALAAAPPEASGAPLLCWAAPRRKRSHWGGPDALAPPADKRPRHERARQGATPGWFFNHILSAYIPQGQRSATAGPRRAAHSRRPAPPLPPGVPLPPPHGSLAVKGPHGPLPVPRWRQQAAQTGPAVLRSKGYSSLWYGLPQPQLQPPAAAPSLQHQQQWAWWEQSSQRVGYNPSAQQGGSGGGAGISQGYPQQGRQQPNLPTQAPGQPQPPAAAEPAEPPLPTPLGPPVLGAPWLSSSAAQHLLGTAVSYIQLLQEQQAARLAAQHAEQQRPAAAAAPQALPASGAAGPWPAGQWGPPHAQQQEPKEVPPAVGYGPPQGPAPSGLPGPRYSDCGPGALAAPGGCDGPWTPGAAAAAARAQQGVAPQHAEQQGKPPPGAQQRTQQEALALLSNLNPTLARYFQ